MRFVPYYRLIWVCLTFLGAIFPFETAWALLDITVGGMVFPNLIGLLGLSGVVVAESRRYFAEKRSLN